MKKTLLFLSILILSKLSFSQNYYQTSGTVSACKGQYFSSAGSATGTFGSGSNGYANNENITETFCSSTGGQLRVNFYWIDLETGIDKLYIYDGPTTASPLIGTLTGAGMYYPGVFTSSGTCLTFKFVSNNSSRWGGWQAFLGCTPQACGTNALASDDCSSAPVICNLDGYCGSTSGWFTRDHGNIEGSTWGGNNSFSCGSIQNNSWISFVASGATANFNVTSSGCSNPSEGIQAVVFAQTACTTFTAKSACQGNGIGTFALSATGLTVGQTYYIMIDGVDGNDCDYVVQATSGVQTVKITSAGSTACVGTAFTLTTTATGVGPFTYNWIPAPNSGQGTTIATYTASSSTTYSCVVGGACGSSQTAVFNQPVNPSPTVSVVGTNSICSAGPATTLTANTTLGSNSISYTNNSDYNIPDNNATGITSTISVTGIAGTVGSSLASVCVNITHGYDGDLSLVLKCPNGSTVNLSSNNGGSGDNYTSTCFTSSGTSIVLGTAPFTGSFTPEQALSLLSGCTANGTWSLQVIDGASLDVGTLLDWTLNFSNSVSYSWSPSSGLSSTTSSVTAASPTATTVYSVTATDASGCSGTTNYTVTVNPTPTVAITSTPTSSLCLGSSITFTAATAATYSWTSSAGGGLSSSSGSPVSATPTATGTITYTVNAASAAGCPASAVKSVTINPIPTANAGTGGTLTCITSTLLLTGSGGGTYAWTGPGIVSGAATNTAIVNASGTYSLAVTNTLGCTSPAATVAVVQNTVAPVATSSVSAVLNCTLASVNVVATTTTTPVSYTWTGVGITSGSNASSATVNAPGTFNYTITNTSNGCQVTGSQAVTQNITAPTVSVSPNATITCAAPTVTITGSATPSTCTPVWSGGVASGATSYTATASSSNVYTLTVTNPANGCTAAKSVTVSPSAGLPVLSTAVISNSITCALSTAQVTLSSTPAGNTYSWTGAGITSGATTSVIAVNASGTYSAVVTNTASACSSSITVFVPINTTPPSPTASNSTTLTCTTTTATLNGGPAAGVTYTWTGPGIVSGANSQNAIANAPGTYTLKVTNSVNGCTNTAVTTLIQNIIPPSPTATNSTTLTCTTTTATLNGGPAAGVTYTWTGASIVSGANSQNAIANAPGTYTLKVTDAVNGCTNTAVTTLIQNIVPPSPTATNSTTLTCKTTTATLNGGPAAGVTYTWTGASIVSGTNSQNAIANAPGTYTLKVTDAVNGCTNTAVTTLIQNIVPPAVTATNNATLSCVVLTATLTGGPASGITYQWSGPSLTGATTNSTAVANGAGTYTLIGTDAVTGCTNIATTVLTANYTSPSPTASNTNTLTCSALTSTVSGTPTSGVTYQWSGPGITGATTNSTAVVNMPGTYVLVVTNTVTGCTNSAQTNVNQNTVPPSPTATNATTLTCTTTTATITGGPTSGVTYQWSGPSLTGATTNSTAVVNGPGTYTLLVTDIVNSCTSTATTTVTQNTLTPIVASANTGSLNCTVLTVSVSATTTMTPVSYNWSGTGITSASNISTITVNQGGTFNYTVTNTSNNCKATGFQTITQNTVSSNVAASSTGSLNCAITTVSASATTSTTPVSYNWSGTGITGGAGTGTISVNQGGTFNYTVTNTANGCVTTGNQTVIQNTVSPSVVASNTGSLNCAISTVSVSATTSTTPVSYNWTGTGITGGVGSGTISVNQGGTFNYTVTNTANSCFTTGNQTVTQNTVAPTTTATTTGSITCVTNTISLSSTLAGMNYTWTAPAGSSILSGSSLQNATAQGLGTYTLNVLNTANSCTFQTTVAAIHNTTTPTSVSAGPTQTLVCVTPTVTLNGVATPSTATANWLGGVSSPTSFTTSTGAAGVYTLQAIEPTTGCFITSTVAVTQSTLNPTVSSNAVTNSITCTNSVVPIGITVTSPGAGSYSVVWPTGTGISGPTNSITTTATLTGVYQVTVTNTSNGCISINSLNVPINQTPVIVSITPASSITCANPTQTLNVSPVGANYTYTWSGTGITSGGTTPNPVVNLGGNFNVVVTNTINGCTGTNTVTVPMDIVTPTVTIGTSSYTLTCTNPTVAISITSTPTANVTYSWTASAGGALNSYTISNPIASSSGVYTVVVINTVNGCSSSLTQNTVQVTPNLSTPSTTLSANTASITCSDPTPSVSITTTASPVSYSWSPSSGIVAGTETTSTPSFSLAGSYSVVVTNTTSGCATSIASNVVNVTLDNTLPTASLTSGVNNGILTCSMTSISISPTVTPNSNVTYTWSPSVGISTSVNQAAATFTAAGIYTLAITNTVTGCVTSLTNTANTFTVIADNTPPTFTLGTTPSVTTTCASPNATLSGTSNADPNSVYTWITPASATVTGNPIVNTTTGIYTVAVTNTINGCSSTSASQNTVEVIADAGIPTVTLSSTTASITCSNPTPSVSITTTTSPVSYSWSPASGIIAGTETTATPSFSLPGSYSVVVTNLSSGCATGISGNVVDVALDNATPTMSLSLTTNDGVITCTNPSVIVTPTTSPSSNLTYTWSPSVGISTSVNQAVATFTAAGIYTLAVTNTITGCVSSLTNTANSFTVMTNTNTPTITVVPTSSNSVIGCGANSSVTYTANATTANGSATYNWNPGAVTTSSFSATSAGVYTSVVTDAVSGCSTTTQFTVTGNSNVPNLSSAANAGFPCGATSASITASSTNTNVSYAWTGPATAVITGSATSTPTIDMAGSYVVTVTDLTTGCTNSNTVSVSQTNVTAAFTADPTSGISPLTVNFTDASTGASNWSWDFGNATTSTLQNPNNVFTSGSYTVMLTASSGTCANTATLVIVVEEGLTLVIPNVFTPNADGINDVFSIASTGIKEISLQIFNRWGQKLYEFSGPKASWDGIEPNGAKATDGTYFFFVKATGFDGNVIEKNGTVNLFR